MAQEIGQKERYFGCLVLEDNWDKHSQGFTAYFVPSLVVQSIVLISMESSPCSLLLLLFLKCYYFLGNLELSPSMQPLLCISLVSHGEKLMDIDTGSCLTFTGSLRVQERGCKVVSSHFDFITNQNTSHSIAPWVHGAITLGERNLK